MAHLTIAGKRVPHTTYERDLLSPYVQGLLVRARSERMPATCHCTGAQRRLVVRKLRGHHFLAAWPGDTMAHSPACRFYSTSEHSDRDTQPLRPIKDRPDGDFTVHLGFDMRGPSDLASVRRSPASRRDGVQGSAGAGDLTLLQLMQYLVERARLNRWAPGWTRDYWRVWREVSHAAELGQVQNGGSLRELIYMPPPFRRDEVAAIEAEWATFSTVLNEQHAGVVERRMIFGEIRALDAIDGGYALHLRHFKLPLLVSAAVYSSLFKDYSRALTSVGKEMKHKSRVLLTALVQPDPTHTELIVVDAALQLCNDMWIPATSGFEVGLANRLVESGRCFEKPVSLMGDATDLPDFVLLDAVRPTALEVFGHSALTYEERKFEKIGKLRRKGLDIWVWRAAAGDAMPGLPIKDGKAPS